MSETNTRQTYHIDASGKRLGHVATEAARVLQGKNTPDFARNRLPEIVVRIENAAKLDIPLRRAKETYQSYSGYPSGRRVERLDHLASRLGYAEVLKRTIKGMLPKNRLQKRALLQLHITE